jgi:hypothetical protein
LILIALLLICIVIAAILWSKRKPNHAPPILRESPVLRETYDSRPSPESDIPGYVEALLQRWTTAGVLTAELADSVRAFERTSNSREVRRVEKRASVHVIAEALAYLGGVLGLAGVGVLLAQFWSDFSDGVRLGVPLVSAFVFVIAGILVPERRSSEMMRLRAFLWCLGTIAAGISAWVFGDVVLDVSEFRQQWLASGIASSILGLSLWGGRQRPVQQFMGLAAAAVAIGTGIGEFASVGFSGLGVWIAGASLLVATLGRSDQLAGVNHLVGSLAVVVGAYLTVADWRGPGLLFVVVSGLILIAPASIKVVKLPSPTPVIMGMVGLLALVQGLPMTLVHFASEAGLVTCLVLWTLGVSTVVLLNASILRMHLVFLLFSGAFIVGGAAITGSQVVGFATLFGLATSMCLIAYGSQPGRALMSVFGLVGILVFIPWMIGHFFPGEGRVPLLIIVSGLLLVVVAVVLMRVGGRLRGEVRRHS